MFSIFTLPFLHFFSVYFDFRNDISIADFLLKDEKIGVWVRLIVTKINRKPLQLRFKNRNTVQKFFYTKFHTTT